MTQLAVVVNDELMLSYDRSKELPDNQKDYLGKLDQRFSQGIILEDERIDNPNPQQCAQYMCLSLMEGIMYSEDNKAAASLAWLATRLPDLQQVVALVDENGTTFEMVFDREYQANQVKVEFSHLNA